MKVITTVRLIRRTFSSFRPSVALVLLAAAVCFTLAHPVLGQGGVGQVFTDVQTQWTSAKRIVLLLGAAICACSMIFAIVKGVGQDWAGMIGGLVAAGISGAIVAYSMGWITGETGVQL